MLNIGEKLKAVVFGIEPFGIFLRDVNHPTTDILVEVTEPGWDNKVSPSDYTKLGAVLEITILHVSEDGTAARAKLE